MSSNRGMEEWKKGEWMRGQYSRRLRLFIEFSLVYKACIFSCFASKRRKNAQILVIAMEKPMHLLPRHCFKIKKRLLHLKTAFLPGERLELSRSCPQKILSLSCLPFHHSGNVIYFIIVLGVFQEEFY